MAFHCVRCNREIERAFKACPHCGEPVTDFLREYADKPIDGKYRILSRLGAGGMGDVYKVEHTFLGAIRVVKVIRPQISDSGDAHDRFLREARLATKVHHPNVATLHDFAALPDGSHYMVWEFIDGENLAQVIRRRGVLPARQAVDIARQALAGLDAIHRAGIVHRDISPENLMITRDEDGIDRVKIIDLGVAKSDEADSGTMTKTGIFVGKLRYCSPEHLGFVPEGEKIDGRADLYSLAIVFVEMLTGRPPFEATSPHQYILHHSRDTELKSIDLGNVPPSLQPIIARALERDRNKRFANARELAEALDRAELPPAIDLDETMRVTSPDAATIRTPLPTRRTEVDPSPTPPPRPPAPAAAAATVAAPVPAPPPAPVAPVTASRSALPLVIMALVFVLVVVAAGAFIVIRRQTAKEPALSQPATTSMQTASAAPKPAPTATVDVTATTAPPAQPAQVTAAAPPPQPEPQVRVQPQPQPQPAAPPKPKPQPVPKPEPVAEPEPQPEPQEEQTFPTFTEGGSSLANDSAMHVAQMQLHNVREVSLTGGGDPALMAQLADMLRHNGLAVVSGADVNINFNGRVDRMRLGRKRRFAEAKITRHGRPVLRYLMPMEEYRVGDNPAEAFARIVSDVFNH